MYKIFIGYDERQTVAYNVLQYSILQHATRPVQISPLKLSTLPITVTGLTPFTYSRFLVPYLCGYKGWAVYLDCDMLLQSDITSLFDHIDSAFSMRLVKHSRLFEWTSMVLFNNAQCGVLTPEYIEEESQALYELGWLPEEAIGTLPAEWNHLVGYDAPNPDAKLIHFTKGIPCHPQTRDGEYAKAWESAQRSMNKTQRWETIFSQSVHASEM